MNKAWKIGSIIILILLCSLNWTSSIDAYSGVNHIQITKHALGWSKGKYNFSKVELMYRALKEIGIDIDNQEEQKEVAEEIEAGSKNEDNWWEESPVWKRATKLFAEIAIYRAPA